MHLGSLIGVVEHVTSRHPLDEVREGDVFIGNDAYTGGGTHLPDIVMVEPVFVDGVVAAWAANIAHHADFVDRGHAHIYQEAEGECPTPHVRLSGGRTFDVIDEHGSTHVQLAAVGDRRHRRRRLSPGTSPGSGSRSGVPGR